MSTAKPAKMISNEFYSCWATTNVLNAIACIKRYLFKWIWLQTTFCSS